MCLKRVLLSIIDNKINFIQQSRGTLLGNKLLCLGPRFESFEGRCSGFILLHKIPHKMSLLDSFFGSGDRIAQNTRRPHFQGSSVGILKFLVLMGNPPQNNCQGK